MKDPMILYPRMTAKEVWDDCEGYVDKCGGMTHEDGEMNWRAAFGADPGVTSCPGCGEYHWNYGQIHKCSSCGIVYPTDWHHMYCQGVAAAYRHLTTREEQNLIHPYWAYGWNQPTDDAWEAAKEIDWKKEIGDSFVYGGQIDPPKDYVSECQEVLGA